MSPPTSDPAAANSPPRYPELDGIRGFAALAVLLFHFAPEPFSQVYAPLRHPWLMPWINGHRAVLIFFVLSGDALASACLRGPGTLPLARLALRRYLRLGVPIALSVTLVYLLMIGGYTYHRDAGTLVNSTWLYNFLGFEANLQNLVWYLARDAFMGMNTPTLYNGFLWTMAVELNGSYFVFLGVVVLQHARRPAYLCALVSVLLLLFGTLYALFFVGVTFALWRRSGALERLRASRIAQFVALALPLVCYVLEARRPDLIWGTPERGFWVSSVLVLSVYVAGPYRWLFSTRLAGWLGTLAFPVYLAQEPVLVSLVSYLVSRFYRAGAADAVHVLLGSIALGVVASYLLAIVLHLAERATLPRLERKVVRWLV